jgi:hypothetical protein
MQHEQPHRWRLVGPAIGLVAVVLLLHRDLPLRDAWAASRLPAPLAPLQATAQAVPQFEPRQNWIGLSARLPVTLTIEGPAPLRVELPEKLLAPETEQDWHIRPTGPATQTPAGPQREKWTQPFRLTPYVPGLHTVQFAPVRVNGVETPVAGFTVQVQVESADPDKPDPRQARPITGIEELPPPAPAATAEPNWWPAVLLGVVLLLAVVLALRRFRRRPDPVSPQQWAQTAFDQLQQAPRIGAVQVEQVAVIVREFIDRRFGIPAPQLTTGELLTALTAAQWPAPTVHRLQQLLAICDQVKFAGRVPDEAECRHLLATARDWVQTTPTDFQPPPAPPHPETSS